MLFNKGAIFTRSLVRLKCYRLEIDDFVKVAVNSVTVREPYPRVSYIASRGLHSRRCLQSTLSSDTSRILEGYKQTLSFPAPTCRIDDLDNNPDLTEDPVVLNGYLGPQTFSSKNLCFVPLLNPELTHSIQIVSAPRNGDHVKSSVHEKLLGLSPITPVSVTGVLRHRKSAPKNDIGDVVKIKTKEVELLDIQALNGFPKDIIVAPDSVFPPEQRHLQIRQEKKIRDALAFRSKVGLLCRDWLNLNRFVEVETPLLFKSTSEGAREFIVPTRRKGFAYALPQSPQQFKQILMSSGIPRYFQIARCFRDEDLRADRQPEFTQLDLEMSFSTSGEVMRCVENLVTHLWKEMLHVQLPLPFPRLTYQQSMARYGSDKPDTRLQMEITQLEHLLPVDLVRMITDLNSPVLEAIIFRPSHPDTTPRSVGNFIKNFLDSPSNSTFLSNPDGGPGIFIYDSTKPLQGLQAFGFEAAEEIERIFQPDHGNVIILQARPNAPFTGGSTSLGNLRLALHREAVKHGLLEAPSDFAPLWITDFPLFSPCEDSEPGQGGTSGLAATHHPFTSPKSASDVDLLVIDPSQAVGDHYDLVVNGVELGGGSRRIHNAEMQRFVMEEVLRMSANRIQEFAHLLEALRAGCPPHAGIAFGFDRLVAVMLRRDTLRDVIAFPKSGKGEDLMMKCPGTMSEETLKTYHLKLQ